MGCGRVGKTLARLWHTHGVLHIQDVLTRSQASALEAVAFIGAGRAVSTVSEMRAADLWMVGTQDADIANTAAHMAQALKTDAHHTPGSLTAPCVFHGSGAWGSDQLAALHQLGWQTASAHCILSFATPEMAVRQFSGTACALEGESGACATLSTAFSGIGAQCFQVASTDKLLYHAAAVFATNFLPVLQSVAEDLWRKTGVPQPVIEALRAQLLANGVANITALGPQGALTGPAARGDVAAVTRQGAAVAAWSAQAGAAYRALSTLALQLAQAAPGKSR